MTFTSTGDANVVNWLTLRILAHHNLNTAGFQVDVWLLQAVMNISGSWLGTVPLIY